MSNNFYSSNNSPIVIKKSLLKTITKIEKAISLINENYPQQISAVTIVENLDEDSDILLSYLTNTNSEASLMNEDEFLKPITKGRKKPREIIRENNEVASVAQNPSADNFRRKSSNKFNSIISIALIISISFNIYLFFVDRHFIFRSNLNHNQEEISAKNVPIEEQDKINAPEQNKKIATPKIVDLDKFPQIKPETSPEDVFTQDIDIISPGTQLEPNNKNKKVTADKDLLMSITNQLQTITDNYENNLINRVNPNYENNSITIIVNDNWQKIPLAQRQELSQKIFNQVKSMDFYRFQLKDIHEHLLARNATIGNKLIVIDD